MGVRRAFRAGGRASWPPAAERLACPELCPAHGRRPAWHARDQGIARALTAAPEGQASPLPVLRSHRGPWGRLDTVRSALQKRELSTALLPVSSATSRIVKSLTASSLNDHLLHVGEPEVQPPKAAGQESPPPPPWDTHAT